MNSKTEYWIETAEYDLDTAKAMFLAKRYLYVGFLCHLTIEKALKAVIAKDEQAIAPKIHNLIKLSDLAGITPLLSGEQQRFLAKLNPLNIEARYPEHREGIYAKFGNAECTQLLKETEELLVWIKEML